VRAKSPETNLEITQAWRAAIDFLVVEQDSDGLKEVEAKALAENVADVAVFEALLDYHLRARDRTALVTLAGNIATHFDCTLNARGARRSLCDSVKRMWIDNLDSILFFHDSSPKLEQARRSILAKDCPEAARVLKEVEAREGDAKPVLDLLERTYACLGDEESEARIIDRLREVRIFGSAADPG